LVAVFAATSIDEKGIRMATPERTDDDWDTPPPAEVECCRHCGILFLDDTPIRLGLCRACDAARQADIAAVARGELDPQVAVERILRASRAERARRGAESARRLRAAGWRPLEPVQAIEQDVAPGRRVGWATR
jgi:hypothetical protein